MTDQTLKNITRGVSITFLQNIILTIIGVLYWVVLARLLGPEKLGVLAIGFSIVSIFGIGTLQGLQPAIVRYVAGYLKKGEISKARSVILYSAKIKIITGLFFAILLFLLSKIIALNVYHNSELFEILRLMSVLVLINSVSSIFPSIFEGLQKFEYSLYLSTTASILNFIFVINLVLFGYGLKGAVFGLITSAIITCIIGYIKSSQLMPKSNLNEKISIKELLGFSVPYSVSTMFYLIYENAGNLILGYFYSPVIVGYFSFAYNIANYPTKISYALHTGLLPSMSELHATKDRKTYEEVYLYSVKYLMILGCFVTTMVIVFSKELVLLLGGAEFLPAVILLQIMVLLNIARIAGAPNQSLFLSIGNTSIILKITMLKAFLEVLLYIALIPLFGAIGAAVAMVISWMIVFGVNFFAVWKIGNIKIPLHYLTNPILGICTGYLIVAMSLPVILKVILGLGLYIISIILTNALDLNDLKRLEKAKTGNMIFDKMVAVVLISFKKGIRLKERYYG